MYVLIISHYRFLLTVFVWWCIRYLLAALLEFFPLVGIFYL